MSNPLEEHRSGKELQEEVRIPYQVIRSARKTMALEIKNSCLLIRIPNRLTNQQAILFAEQHREWIIQRYQKAEEEQKKKQIYTQKEICKYKEELRPVLEHRVVYYAERMGVSYGRITIRDQKTRWGSCSAKGNLNFNWRLALVSQEVADYVVVHELAHRLEMNHSKRFWIEVERILPDYRKRRAMLRQYEKQF